MNIDRKVRNSKNAEEWAASLFDNYPILFDKLNNSSSDENVNPKKLLVEVVKFLYLVSIADVKLSPSLIVDLGWHEFILFTKAYQHFCHDKLGRFIHHVPDNNKASNSRAYLKTLQYYMKHFGKPPVHIWGELSNAEWVDAQCGSCNSN